MMSVTSTPTRLVSTSFSRRPCVTPGDPCFLRELGPPPTRASHPLGAGCGSGLASLALIEALQRRGYRFETVDGLGPTPAMLARYESTLAKRDLVGVRLCRADVLDLEQLPSTGSGYDLIVSTSMLEYVPRGALPRYSPRFAPTLPTAAVSFSVSHESTG